MDKAVDYRVLREESRTARKAHTCECGDAIKVGERYTLTIHLYDGDFAIAKQGHHICSWEQEALDHQIRDEENQRALEAEGVAALSSPWIGGFTPDEPEDITPSAARSMALNREAFGIDFEDDIPF